MKDSAHAAEVLNLMRGIAPTPPTALYLAMCGGPLGDTDFNPFKKSTWTEITTTDCPTYARVLLTLNAPVEGTSTDAGYMVCTGNTIEGSTAEYVFPKFNKAIEIDALVICTHLTDPLSVCGYQASDTIMNVPFATNQKLGVVPASIKVREK